MAVKHGKDSRIYIAQFDFSGEGRSVDINVDADLVEATVFTSTAKQWVEGLVNATIDHRGVFNAADDNWDEWLHGYLGSATEVGITVVPGTPTEGDVCYNGVIKEATNRHSVKVDDIVGVEASYSIDGPLGRSLLTAYKSTATGAFTGTGYDLGAAASTSQMWLVCMHVYEFNGAGTYTLKLQESSDDAVGDPYADVSGGSKACTTVDTFVTTINGAREQWVRVVGIQASGTPTIKCAVSVAIVPKQ